MDGIRIDSPGKTRRKNFPALLKYRTNYLSLIGKKKVESGRVGR